MHLTRSSVGPSASAGWVRRTYVWRGSASAATGGELWFEVPERWAGWISSGWEAPVAGLFFIAMRTGEQLVVDEELSSRFRFGLR